MLRVGDMAPEFRAETDGGRRIRLSDYRGQKVILYFYPKDSTPGCMLEACSFRSMHSEFTAKNAVILGVSGDSAESHDRFKTRHNLPFLLLSDSNRTIATAYGAWREKKLLGIGFMWPARATFVIDEEGRIEAVYDKVNVLGHASRVLDGLVEPAS